MAEAIVPNGIKIEMNAFQNGIPIVNRCYVTQAGAVTHTDLVDVSSVALDFFNDYKASLHPSYVLANITVTDVSVANGEQEIVELVAANQGTASGAAAAANAAVVTSLRTANTGRSFRGRWYWGGLTVASFTNAQTVTGADAVAFAGYFTDFIDALDSIGKTLVVVSRFANGVARLIAVATEVIATITDTKVDSQRRRTAN